MSIHLTSESQCSACLQQRPEIKHVDFDVNWDGPVLTHENGYPSNQIDDLRLCEACVRRAAELLALDPQAMADLERENEELKGLVTEWREYARAQEELIPRRPGRPRKLDETIAEPVERVEVAA